MASPEAILLDINSLLAGEWSQLSILFRFAYPNNNEQSLTARDINQLIDLASKAQADNTISLLNHIEAQLQPVEQLDDESYAILKFVDQLFHNYVNNSKLHPAISPAILQLRLATARKLLEQQLPWQDKQGVTTILNSIYTNAIGWQPELGRAADRYLDQLIKLLDQSKNPIDFTATTNALNSFFEKEQQRIKKLEQRLYDSELGLLHAKHASQFSAKTINRFMGGKKLPASIVSFLQGPWRESMRLLIINKGKDSEEWRRILRLTETLIWSVQPFANDSSEYSQKVYESIAELAEELKDNVIGLQHSSQLQTELDNIEQLHLKVLRGEVLDYQPFELIDNSDPLVTSQLSISKGLVQKAADYDEGQCFIFKIENQEKRAKLTVKITQAQQLLFTNFLGIKTNQYSFDEFAYMLSSNIATPIKLTNPFKATGEKMISTLAERYHQQQQQAVSDQAIEQEIIRQQELTRKAAREKALKEARTHLEIQKSTRKKREKIQQSESRARQEKEILGQLEKLNIGGIILFYNEQKEGKMCKLAAVIKASSEHIFVNRRGIKEHTLSKEQLIQLLLDGTAKIVDPGSNFENTLEQVVNTIRARK